MWFGVSLLNLKNIMRFDYGYRIVMGKQNYVSALALIVYDKVFPPIPLDELWTVLIILMGWSLIKKVKNEKAAFFVCYYRNNIIIDFYSHVYSSPRCFV